MKKFKYVAVNINKRKFSGTYLAENEKELASDLSKQGLYLIKSKTIPDSPAQKFVAVRNTIKLSELTTFCRQFSIMINAGMSIDQTLDVLKKQDYDSFFRSILQAVHEDVKSGVMLSDALGRHKKVFPHFFKSMIRVGEASGNLEYVMTSLADHYEKDAAIKRKTKDALMYPIALLVMTIGVVVLMMSFVVPKFKETLAIMKVEMPPLTKAISDMSDYFVSNWRMIILVILLLAIVLKLFGYCKAGRYFYDTLAIKIPLIGRVNRAKITSRFARGFSLLLSSGMDVVEALEEIVVVLGNKNIEKNFLLAIGDIKQGMNITMALDAYKIFPDILIEMIAVGERTASLEEVLTRSCNYFDEEVDRAIKRFTSMIQPIMLLIMGGIIGVLFIAIYSPILQIIQSQNGTASEAFSKESVNNFLTIYLPILQKIKL